MTAQEYDMNLSKLEARARRALKAEERAWLLYKYEPTDAHETRAWAASDDRLRAYADARRARFVPITD